VKAFQGAPGLFRGTLETLRALPVLLGLAAAAGPCVSTWGRQPVPGKPAGRSATAVTEFPDKVHWLVTQEVGTDGADLAVGSLGTPIDGLVVHLPPLALERSDRVSVGYSSRAVNIRAGAGSGVVIVLEALSHQEFKRPVSVDVALPGHSPVGLVVPYRVDPQGRLHLVQLTRLDPANHRFRFDTFTPGQFTWVHP
jgi:hypothetical protein